jgi:hypothetical protein
MRLARLRRSGQLSCGVFSKGRGASAGVFIDRDILYRPSRPWCKREEYLLLGWVLPPGGSE